jgi:hypothetical protein
MAEGDWLHPALQKDMPKLMRKFFECNLAWPAYFIDVKFHTESR